MSVFRHTRVIGGATELVLSTILTTDYEGKRHPYLSAIDESDLNAYWRAPSAGKWILNHNHIITIIILDLW